MSESQHFYLGRNFDLEAGELSESQTRYDPDDLTTHAVVVGMTGSGKTGLAVDVLEEAALAGIPALLIDPKGDITNLLLHFPNLEPADFQPWVDPDEARRLEITPEQLAQDTAERWRKGLNQWGVEPERIRQVAEAVQYAVYTPGSTSGIPISILTSLKAPELDWEDNQELLRERISSTATALLRLVGIPADPVKSREHILLSNIFETAWSAGEHLNLVELVRQAQDPPFNRLGAFELDEFYPADDRAELAATLNSLIASPSFQAWTEGQALDIKGLLWTNHGRPRHSVIYLAHLSDDERMFFVTLLLSAIETYFRSQPGSSTLKSILYFDELFGYMPPVANPPSKQPLLRLLKQARAFGLGLLLVTQNPVDLDYKGLGNAGTWFIGRLQAERDKTRLLDGLEGAREGLSRSELDRTISAIQKRVFLLHNVHAEAPEIFMTRWAMAYLRGPITRVRLHELNQLVGAEPPAEGAAGAAARAAPASMGRPSIPDGIEEYYLPNNLTVSEAVGDAQYQSAALIYRPRLLAQANARFLDRKLGLDHELSIAALVPDSRRVRWEEHLSDPIDRDQLVTSPAAEAGFGGADGAFEDAQTIKSLEKDFVDYVYHRAELKLQWHPELELIGQPDATRQEFEQQVEQAAQAARDAEAEELRSKYEKKLDSLRSKLSKEERELAEDQAELSARKMEEMATHAENIIGLFSGSRSRRRVSSSLTKRRMSARAKADVEESVEVIEQFKQQLEELVAELAEELDKLDDRWMEIASQTEELVKTPYKKDIYLELFGVAWTPYWQVERDGEVVEHPAFSL